MNKEEPSNSLSVHLGSIREGTEGLMFTSIPFPVLLTLELTLTRSQSEAQAVRGWETFQMMTF